MTTYFKDVPGVPVEFPQWAIDRGFIDCSWQNEAACHAELVLATVRGESKTWTLILLVAEDKVEHREFPDQPRFRLFLSEDNETNIDFSIYAGEAPDEATFLLEKFLTFNHRRS